MANLREIQRRINSVSSTMQITRTMEMVSTAKIQKALSRAEQAAPYKNTISEMLAHVVDSGAEATNPLLDTHEQFKSVLFIVVASDRGLAGGFNLAVQRAAYKEMQKLEAQGVSSKVITCGRKPTEYFHRLGFTPEIEFIGSSSEPTMDQADRVASFAMDAYTREAVDKVLVYYQHARTRVNQDMVVEQLLPVSTQDLNVPNAPRTREAMMQITRAPQSSFVFDPSASEVLGYLMPAYARTVIFHALLDSAAAEHGARRRAMQSAREAAEDLLSSLNRTYNRVRQSSITTELNEIIGGTAALEEQ